MTGCSGPSRGLKQGYDPDEVDDFFAHARAVYEQGPAAALASKDVRGVAFDMVRGGYVTAAVDAALDRLEAAFVARARAEFVADARASRAGWTT